MLLAFLGVSDLTALSMSEEVTDSYWGTQTPVRLAFLFALTGYSYAFKPGGVFGSSGKGAGDHLKNSVVFAFGFVELSVWFWVSCMVRDGLWKILALTDSRSSSRCVKSDGNGLYVLWRREGQKRTCCDVAIRHKAKLARQSRCCSLEWFHVTAIGPMQLQRGHDRAPPTPEYLEIVLKAASRLNAVRTSHYVAEG